MNKLEATIVGIFVGILCPMILFMLFGGIVAALNIFRILTTPDTVIIIVAFSGTGIGMILDMIYLNRWVTRFYVLNKNLLVLIYLLLSIIAVTIFMGFPFGNIILGVMAGLYIGRRLHHTGVMGRKYVKAARMVSFFTGTVTSIEALPIGLLALREPILADALCEIAGLEQSVTAGSIGITLITFVCMVLFVFQFWCTRTATAWAFRYGK